MRAMAAQSTQSPPILWHLPVSHYSEKARWALDYKRVPHLRRAPLPGLHIPLALVLTGGRRPTLPILVDGGEVIADSTEIVRMLEERFPEPRLYPRDPQLRSRALELEDYFDEELGPKARLLAFHEMLGEPEVMTDVAVEVVPPPLRRARPFVGAYARALARLRWRAGDSEAAAAARRGIVDAIERIETELEAGGGDYLVGDEFSVADLTAAALFYPVVAPAEGPVSAEQARPAAFERFREGIRGRRGFAWVEEMFRRHRHQSGSRRDTGGVDGLRA